MRTADGYKTKQRAEIEKVLKDNGNRHFTAEEICELLIKNGCEVGRTTVYRCLDKLCSEGRLRKYSAEPGEPSCYQYVQEGGECHEHFHLRCVKCGELIHIECEHMDELSGHIMSEHGFKVDKLKTVLYGVCEKCQKE